MHQCATCRHATRPSKDQKLSNWMDAKNMAFCAAYKKFNDKRLMVPLQNAAGTVCEDRWYEAKVTQGELI